MDKELPPWTRDFDNTPVAAELRDDSILHEAQSIFIGSDYGGEHRTAAHAVYSFLIVDFNRMGSCVPLQVETRRRHLGGQLKTVEFKKLAKNGRDRALPDWLSAADSLRGYLITLAVDATLPSLFAQPAEIERLSEILSEAKLGAWKTAVAEKLLRILHFQSYLCSLLVRPGQKVLWMTDRDAICANLGKTEDLLNCWRRVLPLYLSHAPPKLGLALPLEVQKPGDEYLNDALTYPDLAAGAIEEFLGDYFAPAPTGQLKRATTGTILQWLATDSPTFKKRTLHIASFTPPGGGVGFQTSYLRLDPAPKKDEAGA